jgi:diphthine-ammonia ligase
MSLPVSESSSETPKTSGFDADNFKLQTVLSLQHLWRIGQEMNVQWWTGAVAYLPHDTLENAAEKAAIVSRAWALIHRREVKDDDSEDEDVRDLWEEKYYAGMEVRGVGKVEKMLPDWEIVEISGEEGGAVPPFWVVEVEELPRASAVEWHTQLGVVDGPVKVSSCDFWLAGADDVQLYSRHSDDGWSIHQCSFGGTVQSVVMIDDSESVSGFQSKLEKALKVLGPVSEVGKWICTSYLNVSIPGMWVAGNFGSKIPCRSMWNAAGKRLAAVMILDTS